ncbi:MAG TPA: FKBP-type peptidyl-prolyl cis-trans isomerase [Gemmataceae bacterium]|nr:FKBP-type peptidyl-prolyl cis-trans isomerase [Gemmataceae bacterium]
MQTVQMGDSVQVHYEKRFQDGTVFSSRSHRRMPLQIVIGHDHPRLPGLGLALIGLSPGQHKTLLVPAERAYGFVDPARVRSLPRARFSRDEPLKVGKWVILQNHQGRRRRVRVVEIGADAVVVDTNHRWAGMTLELDVELIGIEHADDSVTIPGSN